MPYLRFRGFDEKLLLEMLPELQDQFSLMAAVPPEIVKIELLSDPQIAGTPCSLEILMFPRDQDKHDSIVAALHTALSMHGYRDAHIFFVLLSPSLYYKQGKPLKDATRPSDSHASYAGTEKHLNQDRALN